MTTPDPRPTSEKDAALVQQMFDRVAPRYDIANTVFSFGQDRHWRRVAASAAGVGPGDRVLDVATGTGALAAELAGRGAEVLALDFSWNMVATGAARVDARTAPAAAAPSAGRIHWLNGDGTRLPLPDASVDAVTIAFGLRNLPDTEAGLRELARVTRPGGRLVVLEFSTPTWSPFRTVYNRYLLGAIPQLAQVVTSDPAAYRYLAESIQAWPDQEELAAIISGAGWGHVAWKNLTGGIVAAHRGTRV